MNKAEIEAYWVAQEAYQAEKRRLEAELESARAALETVESIYYRALGALNRHTDTGWHSGLLEPKEASGE